MVKISLFCDSSLKIWAIRVSVQLDYWQGSWEHRLFGHHCWSVGLLWHTQRSWPAAPRCCHSGPWVDRRTVGAPVLRDTGFAGTGSKGDWWQTPPYTEKTSGTSCLFPEPCWRRSSVMPELVVWILSPSALPGESTANVSGHLLFWCHLELLNFAFPGFLLWKFWRGASKGKVNYGDFNYTVRADTDGGADTWELRVKLLAFEVLSNATGLLGSNCILQLCDLLHLPLCACVCA